MPGIHRVKLCAICGKADGKNWVQHWTNNHPGSEMKELLPGQTPSHPLPIQKKSKQSSDQLKGKNKQPPVDRINQQDIPDSHPEVPLDMVQQDQEIEVNREDNLVNQHQAKDEIQQTEDDLDYSSTPTQQLFTMAELILQTIKDRLVKKERVLEDRLTYAFDTSQSIEERLVSRIYQPEVGCHPCISRALPIEQVNTSFSTKDVISFQGCTRTSIAPESRQLMARIIKEQERIRSQTKELECAIKCLRVISLPTDLTLNNCQADVNLARGQLSKRQRILLRQPTKQVAVINQPEPQPSNSIKLTPEEERVITFPFLYGSALDRIEEQPVGPRHLVVDDLVDIGDDIKEGVSSVDGARQLLILARKKVSHLKHSRKLKERLLTLIEYQRDHISRGLQHFLNMVLLPYPTIDMVKTKVTLVFNSPFMKDRTFTVSDASKEKRDFTKTSIVSLRSLTNATTCISETASAILDFIEGLEKLELADEDKIIINPLLNQVINAVRGATGDIMLKGIHRMMRLQAVLKRVVTRLQEPSLLIYLVEQDSKTKYWTNVNLRDHVKLVMRQQRDNAV